ncbi:MAG: hypothetical protein Unbinned8596contig1000_46 [Prokaryotic dsDNA virus sp.]|nr:MAG: hypothetical protein Unbinned8596contig1000_46 [Prokaryotic dsDNA virus sp.]|tara:strand:+ start:43257 stop:43556 length:300 start_codon:yes stop_codon:yes gene_type:complete
MELDTLISIIAWVGAAIAMFILGYIGWLMRRLHTKVEDSISRKEVEQLVEAREAVIMRDVTAVKEDTRSMAESVVNAVKGLESRFDTLMFQLMKQGNDQ